MRLIYFHAVFCFATEFILLQFRREQNCWIRQKAAVEVAQLQKEKEEAQEEMEEVINFSPFFYCFETTFVSLTDVSSEGGLV